MKDKLLNSHYFKLVVSSLIAGFIMAIASFELVVAKSMNLFYVGGFVQGFGLLAIMYLGLELYNTKLCSIYESKTKLKTLLDIFIVLVVNISIIVAIACLLRALTSDKKELVDAAKYIADSRVITIRGSQGKEWYDALIASLMCGMIVSIGVNIFKKTSNFFIKFIAIIVAVGIYVICGFEQIMTNTFYITFANMISIYTFLDLLIVVIGNTIGGSLIYFAFKVIDKKLIENKTQEKKVK